MRRREFISAIGGAAAWPLASRAQPGKVHTILWVSTEAQPDPFIAGFREGMKARGYSEGQNVVFVLRYAPGNPAAVRAMLPELLATPADLIVSSGPAIQAMRAQRASPSCSPSVATPSRSGSPRASPVLDGTSPEAHSCRSMWRKSGLNCCGS